MDVRESAEQIGNVALTVVSVNVGRRPWPVEIRVAMVSETLENPGSEAGVSRCHGAFRANFEQLPDRQPIIAG